MDQISSADRILTGKVGEIRSHVMKMWGRNVGIAPFIPNVGVRCGERAASRPTSPPSPTEKEHPTLIEWETWWVAGFPGALRKRLISFHGQETEQDTWDVHPVFGSLKRVCCLG